jgi:hypothetical protein
MKLALSAKVTCDPKRVLENRWVHDTAHLLADNLRKAVLAARKRIQNQRA